MKVAGIHPLGHDSCVVEIDLNAKRIRASTLERFSRKKHDARYIEELKDYGWKPLGSPEISCVSNLGADYRDIKQAELFQKRYELDRLIQKKASFGLKITRLVNSVRSKSAALLVFNRKRGGSKLLDDLRRIIPSKEIIRMDHHLCHAVSTFFTRPSSFTGDLVITLDGQGDDSSGKIFKYDGSKLKEISSNAASHSICGLFSIFTEVAGYAPNADEGKLEALANFYDGESSTLLDTLRNAFVLRDGMLVMTVTDAWPFSDVFSQRKQIKRFLAEQKKGMSNEEFAYVIQTLFEEKVGDWIAHWTKCQTQQICLAGGGFANVKLNRVLFETHGHDIHIFPAMGDDGAAFGAAILAALKMGDDLPWLRNMQEPYYGHPCGEVNVEHTEKIKRYGFKHTVLSHNHTKQFIIHKMVNGKIGAIYQGNAEFGPRALGNRSIIAAGTDPNVRDDLNNRFKRREWYQPFCPMILEQDAKQILEKFYLNRHMTCAFSVKEAYLDKIPAVVHIDGTARAQIITAENEFWYEILSGVRAELGLGVALNTSFNLHGRAIVNTIDDALDDFIDCGIDYLVIGNHVIER